MINPSFSYNVPKWMFHWSQFFLYFDELDIATQSLWALSLMCMGVICCHVNIQFLNLRDAHLVINDGAMKSLQVFKVSGSFEKLSSLKLILKIQALPFRQLTILDISELLVIHLAFSLSSFFRNEHFLKNKQKKSLVLISMK